jgi:hypothetical protein
MKKHHYMGLIIGAALLRTIDVGYVTPASAQGVIVPGQLNESAQAETFSAAVAEVTRLAASGVSDEVVLAFVKRSTSRFGLSDKAIVYLKDLGLSQEVIAAMLERDSQLPLDALPPSPAAEPTPAADTGGSSAEPVAAPYDTNPPADVSYFYTQLSPYGTWASVEGVGWCWQPHCCAYSNGWRPYCHGGHWVYADCGWYWQSDYSWGWAPFHYGRWQHHERCGWVWCPDRQWGPAWVTWRVSGDHCGWAPLPPNSIYVIGSGWRHRGIYYRDGCDFDLKPHHFTFVATKDFTSHEIGRQKLPDAEARNIYSGTTIINGQMSTDNHTLLNHGVPVERVAAVTHTDIRKVSIRDVPAGSGGMNGGQRNGVNGSAVYRRELQAPVQTPTMAAQKLDNNHTTVLHQSVTARPLEPVHPVEQRQYGGQANQHPAKSPNQKPSSQQAPARRD